MVLLLAGVTGLRQRVSSKLSNIEANGGRNVLPSTPNTVFYSGLGNIGFDHPHIPALYNKGTVAAASPDITKPETGYSMVAAVCNFKMPTPRLYDFWNSLGGTRPFGRQGWHGINEDGLRLPLRSPSSGAYIGWFRHEGDGLPGEKPANMPPNPSHFSDEFWRKLSADYAQIPNGGRPIPWDDILTVGRFLDAGPLPTYPEIEIKLPFGLSAGEKTATGPTKPEKK